MLNRLTKLPIRPLRTTFRSASTWADRPLVPRRAMLYVPGSNPSMLAKSLESAADCVAFDLEDAVAPGKKAEARQLVADILNGDKLPKGEVMVRINSLDSPFAEDDLDVILRTKMVAALALPKTTTPDHLSFVADRINKLAPDKGTGKDKPIRLIAMIENARGMEMIGEIARAAQGHLDALLFAAEDYCADLGIIRTEHRSELLYHRAKLVVTAKAYGLQAIDLVCTEFKNEEALRLESEEGRRLGFDGKQAIHPAQVEIIHRAFSPSKKDIAKAARIRYTFELNDKEGKGAYALDGKMIDAPVYKQALGVLKMAEAAGVPIPDGKA